jgi:glycine dehydrogenase
MTTAPIPFPARHIGPWQNETRAMLTAIGVPSVETLISAGRAEVDPARPPLDLPAPASEAEALGRARAKMGRNKVLKSFIGAGYHGVNVPPVIQRNLFENPAWYTAYTPYQAEISQGRLELLFHFQTLVAELTGLPVASASLLDEATAVAEAVGIALRHHRDKRSRVAIAGARAPAGPRRRSHPRRAARHRRSTARRSTTTRQRCSVPGPIPTASMATTRRRSRRRKAVGAIVIFVSDPLSLTVTDTPASLGADIAAGSMQRFGVPMGFGGPHAAYCAVSDKLTRLMPGRLVGQSVDSKGRPGYRLALQTREQHIRRDKATSNICTAQALLANMAASYAIWHGSVGLQAIAERVHALASRLAES